MKTMKRKIGTVLRVSLMMMGMASAVPEKPNIIYIMCDDLGYGQLGCYGQTMIRTPHLDAMAKAGMRFTDHYAGTAVCAPSRCALMTGKHVGHAYIRGNMEARPSGQKPIPASEITVAERLKEAGYATACIGKWGLGPVGSSGDPNRQGFDYFYGFNCQRRAHHHYQEWLWKNDRKVDLNGPYKGKGYTQYHFTSEALKFISDNKEKPFFLYLAYTIPHTALEIPEEDACYQMYLEKDWPKAQKKHAAMISRVDKDVGTLLEHLKRLGLDRRTLVVFTSDNGPHSEGGAKPGFFKDSGQLRGVKRDMYEGGTRVPFLTYWPGTISPGGESDHVFAHWDLMATACELAGLDLHPGTDSLSYVPTLLGQEAKQEKHDYVYFELHHPNRRALRSGSWVLVQQYASDDSPDINEVELYHLGKDPGQQWNVASQFPEKLSELKKMMAGAATPSALFPMDRNHKTGKKLPVKPPVRKKKGRG